MKVYKTFLALALLSITDAIHAQVIDTIEFETILNQDFLPYKNKKGEFLGCGYTYECTGMTIIFYEINLNKQDQKIYIRGRCIDPRGREDTLGVYAGDIFLARPGKNKLNKIRPLASTTVSNGKAAKSNEFPNRNGDFVIEGKFGSKDCLYFIHPSFRPIEYSIYKLLSNDLL